VWGEIDDEQSKKWFQTMQLTRMLKRAWSTSVVVGLQIAQDQVVLKSTCLFTSQLPLRQADDS